MPPAREFRLSLCLLAGVLLANAIGLWPELSISRFDSNDNVSHFALVQGMVRAVEQGESPIDFWSPECVFGFPVFRVYQPLAHGMVTLAYFALGKTISLMTLFCWARFLAIALLPLSFFVAARLLDFPPLESAAAGLLAPLLAAWGDGLFGLGYHSYLWSGYGLFPQSVAANFLPVAIGLCYRAIRFGERITLAGVALAVTCLTHFFFGYMGALTACLFALLPYPQAARPLRLRRLIWIGAAAFALCAFQLLPILQDGPIVNHSRYEPPEKWDSYGAARVLGWLATGGLMDHDRIPVLTLIAFAGIVLCALRWKRGKRAGVEAALLASFLLWLLLFFGRPVWGGLLLLVGITSDMHIQRLVAAVQLFLLLLAAMGLGALWREAARRWSIWAAAAITAVLLFPAVQERAAALRENARLGRLSLAVVEREHPNIEAAMENVRHSGGRAYAGLAATWGTGFRVGSVPIRNFLMTAGVPAVSHIYHSLALPSDIMMEFDDTRPAHYRLFNVRSVIMPAASAVLPFVTPRIAYGSLHIFDAPGGGYFDLVDVAATVPVTRATFFGVNDRWFKSDMVERRQHLLLTLSGDAPPVPSPRDSNPGVVRGEWQTGQIYSAEIDVARASFLLFKMTWHPNWKVLVDGQPRPTLMLSPGFLGVAVDPGTHRVVCRYEPGPMRPILALCGIAVALAMWVLERKRRIA